MKKAGPGILMEDKGFTLIELLLAMLITSIIILGVNAAYRQAHIVWSNVEDRRPIYHDARLITETLRQELSCLYFPPEPEKTPEDEEGDEEGQDGPFEPLSTENGGLAFYTLTPSWKGGLGSARIAKVRYVLTSDEFTGESVLLRFEQPCSGEKLIGSESADIVAKGLSEFSISIIEDEDEDKSGDEGEGDGQGRTPPKALEVSLKWTATEDAPDLGFQTTILIPCQRSLRSAQPSGAAPPS